MMRVTHDWLRTRRSSRAPLGALVVAASSIAVALALTAGSDVSTAGPPQGASADASHPPSELANAVLERRAGGAGLEAEVRSLLASRREPFWIGYSVPAQGDSFACCEDWGQAGPRDCGCRLEANKGSFNVTRDRETAAAEETREGLFREQPRSRLVVLLRGEGGHVVRIRAVSEGCGLDAGRRPFVWLERVTPAESVDFLGGIAERYGKASTSPPAEEDSEGPGDTRRLVEGALLALAHHGDPSADAVLERFVAPDRPLGLRKKTAFWLAEARGRRGAEILARLRRDPDQAFRKSLTFALTRSQDPAAVDAILDMAHHDSSPHVRGQALFWLGQMAAPRAVAVIRQAAEDDPEIEVKKKAVFALSQLPRGEGVPHLIRLARTHPSPQVRKQAVFWLGQSGDPRALSFFEEVLKR